MAAPDQTVREAAQMMASLDAGVLPVRPETTGWSE